MVTNTLDGKFLDLGQTIIDTGYEKSDRTETGTRAIHGYMLRHSMNEGFPLLTTKSMAKKTMSVELEGFIKGITDKQWYKDRGCDIWNQWCNPQKLLGSDGKPIYSSDNERKEMQLAERDLGPIYGWQWRNFGARYRGFDIDYSREGTDQLAKLIEGLKNGPESRRHLVTAMSPPHEHQMALPPCHNFFQVHANREKNGTVYLDLEWYQRSVDTLVGLPFNIASYGLLLELLAKETGYKARDLIGSLGDTHVYNNHHEGFNKQIQNRDKPFELPKLHIDGDANLLDWKHDQAKFENYKSHGKIDYPINV